MLRDAVRGVVVVATEFAEEAGKRVRGVAEGLLERSGVDVAEVERRLAEQIQPSARSLQALQSLAGEAVTAGRAGIDLAVGVARGEVEKVFERVGDQVVKVGVVLGYLEGKLREVEEESVSRPKGRAGGLFEAGWEGAEAEEPVTPVAVQVDEPETPAKQTAAKRTVEKPAAEKAAAEKAPTGKPAAKKTVAKKTVARKSVASGTPAAKKSAAKKTAVKKTVVRKSVAEKTVAKKTAPKKVAPKKSASEERDGDG